MFNLKNLRKHLIPGGLCVPEALMENLDMTKAAMHEQVLLLGKYVDALALAGRAAAEDDLVEHFIHVIKGHSKSNVVAAVTATESDDGNVNAKTMARLRLAFLQFVPLDVEDMLDHQALVSIAVPPVSCLLDRTCAAMMSFMANPPSVAAAAPRPKGVFTLTEQDAYIKRLQEEVRVRNNEQKQALHEAHNGSGGGCEIGRASCRERVCQYV